jgi:HopA1 effector protein family
MSPGTINANDFWGEQRNLEYQVNQKLLHQMTQLFDFQPTQQSTMMAGQLLNTLEDIVCKVEIQTNFSIHHPDYKPLKLPDEVVERFHKLPKQIQQKYLSLQLQSFIYGIYYNGSMRSALALDSEANSLNLDLENNTLLGVDIAFYQRLHQSNCGEGYFDPGWSVLREETDGTLAVIKGNLRLHVKRDKHLQPAEKSATVGELIAIRMPKNLVQNGFYMAVGNAGIQSQEHLEQPQQIVRVYFNLTPSGAVEVMRDLTQQLNAIAVEFSFKVLYNCEDYKRYDSGVLYFDKKDYQGVRKVIQAVYQQKQSHFKPQVPLFTKQLESGLGLAEEPEQKFGEQESFGTNRCQIVANGLLSAWLQGDDSKQGRMQAILRQFSSESIDLEHPYLNANSEDIYY